MGVENTANGSFPVSLLKGKNGINQGSGKDAQKGNKRHSPPTAAENLRANRLNKLLPSQCRARISHMIPNFIRTGAV